jgi:hypothetical protein
MINGGSPHPPGSQSSLTFVADSKCWVVPLVQWKQFLFYEPASHLSERGKNTHQSSYACKASCFWH